MRIKFQLSILINKKVGPSAPRKGRFVALGDLTQTYAYHWIPFCMNIMHTKFQPPILINKKSLKIGGFRNWVMGPTGWPKFQNRCVKKAAR